MEEVYKINGKDTYDNIIYEGDFTFYKYPNFTNIFVMGKGTVLVNDGNGNCIQSGNICNSLLNGKGKKVDSNGIGYEGNFVNDLLNGTGKITCKEGTTFEGNFHNDSLNGTGKITFKDGTIHEGNFEFGLLNGKGKITIKNGTTHEGNFHNGLLHGKGKYTFKHGTTHEGNFHTGILNGTGKITIKNGTIIEGKFKNNSFIYTKKSNKNGIFTKYKNIILQNGVKYTRTSDYDTIEEKLTSAYKKLQEINDGKIEINDGKIWIHPEKVKELQITINALKEKNVSLKDEISIFKNTIDEQTKKYENSDTKKELIDKDETINKLRISLSEEIKQFKKLKESVEKDKSNGNINKNNLKQVKKLTYNNKSLKEELKGIKIDLELESTKHLDKIQTLEEHIESLKEDTQKLKRKNKENNTKIKSYETIESKYNELEIDYNYLVKDSKISENITINDTTYNEKHSKWDVKYKKVIFEFNRYLKAPNDKNKLIKIIQMLGYKLDRSSTHLVYKRTIEKNIVQTIVIPTTTYEWKTSFSRLKRLEADRIDSL